MNKELAVKNLNEMYKAFDNFEKALLTQDYLNDPQSFMDVQKFFENEKKVIQDTILAVIVEEEEEAE